jgi:aminopeptidase N
VHVTDDTTPVALTAPEAGEVLLADVHDDTWAKVRLGDDAVAALPRLLPAVAEPVTRAVVWNSLTYAVDDAELDPHTMLDILEAALPAEQQDIALSAMLSWTNAVLRGRYLRPGEADRRIAALATAVLHRSVPGSGAQIAAARGVAASETVPDALLPWLDGAPPEGLAVDPEMRWTVLQRLCVLGAVDEARIDQELARDRSAAGAVHAARCRAALPTPKAKAQAWQLITHATSADNYTLYATCEGFWAPEQHELTAPYVGRYFEEIPAAAGLRTGWVVAEMSRLAYPRYAVSAETADMAEAAMGRDLATGVRRSIADRTDDLRRALAVRRRFSAPA